MNNSPPNVATRAQQGGTCWFHAIINGLLMSWKTRKILREYLARENRVNTGNKSCPVSRAAFWGYIAHRLKGPGAISPSYSNANIIRSSGARRRTVNPLGFIPRKGNTRTNYMRRVWKSRSGVTGGSFPDLLNIYEKMFGNVLSYKNKGPINPLFVIRKGNDFKPIIIHKGVEYSLSHSYLAMYGKSGLFGHAIAGYVSRLGTYRIFESGWNKVFSYDWKSSEDDKTLLDWFNTEFMPFGLKLASMKKWAVYVRMDKI